MNVSTEFRAVATRLAFIGAFALGLGACSDADGPLALDASSNAQGDHAAVVTGAYETRSAVTLPSGGSVYLVGVYFGAEPGQPTYLAQVGVSAGSSSRLLMEQDSYTVTGGAIEFGVLVERGTLREDGRVLDAVLVVDGQRVAVTLARK